MKTVGTYVHLMFRSVFSVTEVCLSHEPVALYQQHDCLLCKSPATALLSHMCSNLGAFAQLRIATVSFDMSVRPSAWNSASTGRTFIKFDIPLFLENLSRKFKFH